MAPERTKLNGGGWRGLGREVVRLGFYLLGLAESFEIRPLPRSQGRPFATFQGARHQFQVCNLVVQGRLDHEGHHVIDLGRSADVTSGARACCAD
ncbi:MAG: hypothetical protein ABIU29_07545 [Chthoniobacterales bacterium]